MSYKKIIQEIKDLPWDTYNPKNIIFLSWVTSMEFAHSLRCALKVFPDDKNLKEMAEGELETDNLSYAKYKERKADHSEFLYYFMNTEPGIPPNEITPKVFWAHGWYEDTVRSLTRKGRAMSIFSREQELHGIFEIILKSHDWEALGFGWFKYYLERHIQLDTQDGGHAYLVGDFKLDEKILEKFYQIRLELYKEMEN